MRPLFLLLAAVLLAGCQASPTLERLRGEPGVPEPIFLEREASVNASHDARYPVMVAERASELNVSLQLDARTPSLPGLASPARLQVDLLAPSGAVVRSGVVDAARPSLVFVLAEFVERGEYVLHVHGQGVSESLQGQGYGASYSVTLEVVHA